MGTKKQINTAIDNLAKRIEELSSHRDTPKSDQELRTKAEVLYKLLETLELANHGLS